MSIGHGWHPEEKKEDQLQELAENYMHKTLDKVFGKIQENHEMHQLLAISRKHWD